MANKHKGSNFDELLKDEGLSAEAEAIAAKGAPGIWGLSADTDGVDGAEEIAGAVFTPDTLSRARAKRCDPQAMLDDNDGHGFFELLGDGLVTGPTRTNVNDFRVTLIAP